MATSGDDETAKNRHQPGTPVYCTGNVMERTPAPSHEEVVGIKPFTVSLIIIEDT